MKRFALSMRSTASFRPSDDNVGAIFVCQFQSKRVMSGMASCNTRLWYAGMAIPAVCKAYTASCPYIDAPP